MIIRLHFVIEVRKNSSMRQGSLFSRAHIAEMRNPAKARNHSPEREDFRRAQQRRRVFGLERRHAEKLRRLRRDGAAEPVPTGLGHPAASVAPTGLDHPAVPVAPTRLDHPAVPADAGNPALPAVPVAPSAAPTVPPVVAAPRPRAAARCAPDNRRPPAATESLCGTATTPPAPPTPRTTEAPSTPYPANSPTRPTASPSAQVRQLRAASPPRWPLESVPQALLARPPSRRHRNPRHRPTGCKGDAVPLPGSLTSACRPLTARAANRQLGSGHGHRGRPDDPLFEVASSRMSLTSTRSRPQRRPALRRCRIHLSPPHKKNGRTTEYNRYPINS
ncbi:hypothetical protein FHR83_005551 [Actinoplanes campanulatus]|uniref:Uncharacterized protein n=1 Tax=Actinoplanes campanulatus TaxID=113559 RepID=A0A7W5AKQ1_9ACTN|nr:hypothetical protein [Actinoplanes campanulatus]